MVKDRYLLLRLKEEFIDLENKITSKGAGPYLYDHIHYNDEGSELVAELISREIMKVLD